MEIIQEQRGMVALLILRGKLDAGTANTLENKLLVAIDGGNKQFCLNCSALDYVSSAGLRVLLMAAKKLKPGNGEIVLSCLKPHIQEVFDIAGFSSIFPIHETDEQALRAMQNFPG
jgi:anti-sigma B factor antagonist